MQWLSPLPNIKMDIIHGPTGLKVMVVRGMVATDLTTAVPQSMLQTKTRPKAVITIINSQSQRHPRQSPE